MTRQQLLNVLAKIQNCPRFEHVDIMTFTGFCDTAEVSTYVMQKFSQLPKRDQKRIVEATREIATEKAA